MEGLLAFFAGFIMFIFIVVIVLYVLGGIGLMRIADKQNIKGVWMAWIPFFNLRLIGKLAVENKFAQWLLLVLALLGAEFTSSVIVNGVTTTKNVIALPSPIREIFVFSALIVGIVYLYKIYNKLSDKAVIMIVFTILTCGLLAPIFLFAIRNNEVRV